MLLCYVRYVLTTRLSNAGRMGDTSPPTRALCALQHTIATSPRLPRPHTVRSDTAPGVFTAQPPQPARGHAIPPHHLDHPPAFASPGLPLHLKQHTHDKRVAICNHRAITIKPSSGEHAQPYPMSNEPKPQRYNQYAPFRRPPESPEPNSALSYMLYAVYYAPIRGYMHSRPARNAITKKPWDAAASTTALQHVM